MHLLTISYLLTPPSLLPFPLSVLPSVYCLLLRIDLVLSIFWLMLYPFFIWYIRVSLRFDFHFLPLFSHHLSLVYYSSLSFHSSSLFSLSPFLVLGSLFLPFPPSCSFPHSPGALLARALRLPPSGPRVFTILIYRPCFDAQGVAGLVNISHLWR